MSRVDFVQNFQPQETFIPNIKENIENIDKIVPYNTIEEYVLLIIAAVIITNFWKTVTFRLPFLGD